MGKTSKWLRSFLTGKKDHNKVFKDQKEKIHQTEFTTIPGTPKEKRRWSFRRSSATGPTSVFNNRDLPIDEKPSPSSPLPPQSPVPILVPQQQPIMVAVVENEDNVADIVQRDFMIEEIAAVKIQACFRSHLARKALRALRGLVKLQALVRGHLVRKQATATLRCMQALITLQAKAREQRIRMIEDSTKSPNPRSSIHKTKNINTYQDNERSRFEENIKIVEMDIQSREYYKNPSQFGSHYSPAPSAITEMSPRAYSGHFEDYNSFTTAQSSPQCFRLKEYCNGDSMCSYDYPLFPNYMANTQSSKAKARSQSAPKQRPAEVYERQPSGKRRSSMEAPRNGVPRAGRMQRSSSQLGPSAAAAKENQYHQQNYHNQYYPWMAIKLDRSNISLMESECGSTSTVMTSRPTAEVAAATNGYGNMY